jgi:hypothetical protein
MADAPILTDDGQSHSSIATKAFVDALSFAARFRSSGSLVTRCCL